MVAAHIPVSGKPAPYADTAPVAIVFFFERVVQSSLVPDSFAAGGKGISGCRCALKCIEPLSLSPAGGGGGLCRPISWPAPRRRCRLGTEPTGWRAGRRMPCHPFLDTDIYNPKGKRSFFQVLAIPF